MSTTTTLTPIEREALVHNTAYKLLTEAQRARRRALAAGQQVPPSPPWSEFLAQGAAKVAASLETEGASKTQSAAATSGKDAAATSSGPVTPTKPAANGAPIADAPPKAVGQS
jgi:hypothetical protein